MPRLDAPGRRNARAAGIKQGCSPGTCDGYSARSAVPNSVVYALRPTAPDMNGRPSAAARPCAVVHPAARGPPHRPQGPAFSGPFWLFPVRISLLVSPVPSASLISLTSLESDARRADRNSADMRGGSRPALRKFKPLFGHVVDPSNCRNFRRNFEQMASIAVGYRAQSVISGPREPPPEVRTRPPGWPSRMAGPGVRRHVGGSDQEAPACTGDGRGDRFGGG